MVLDSSMSMYRKMLGLIEKQNVGIYYKHMNKKEKIKVGSHSQFPIPNRYMIYISRET